MLQNFYREGREILKKYGVEAPFKIEFNGRLKRVLGRYYKEYSLIQISSPLVRAHGWDVARKTFLHELAHHIVCHKYGYFGHGATFLQVCLDIGGSCHKPSIPDKLKAQFEAIPSSSSIPYRYVYSCTCGVVYNRHRKLKAGLLCGRCRKPVSEMQLKRNM